MKGLADNIGLSFKSQNIEVDYWQPLLLLSDITEADNLISIEVNGAQLEYDKQAHEILIDILFDASGDANVRIICADDIRVRYSFIKQETILLDLEILQEMSDFSRTLKDVVNDASISIGELFDGIKNKKINLLSVVEPITDVDDESLLEDIKKALPYAKGICSSPRLQLKTKYELMDVELAKRITSHSMQHLAAHSEHWKARSITGLIPKRIVARTSEDNLNIYENLFFGKVIDVALCLVAQKQRDTMQALSQKSALIDWNKYSQELGDYKKALLLQKMLPDFDQNAIETAQSGLQKYQNLLEKIERGLITVISSQFYQELETVGIKKFPLPVKPTNILKMDSRYRQILKLWTKLQAYRKQQTSGFDGAVVEPYRSYFSYVALLLLYGLYNEGYQIDESSKVTITNDILSFKTNIYFDKIKVNLEIRNAKGTPYIYVGFEERQLYRIPYKLPYAINNLKAYYPEDILQDDDDGFVTLLHLSSKDRVKKYFRSIKAAWMKTQSDSKAAAKIRYWDKQWQKTVEDALIEVKSPKKHTLGIFPLWGTFRGDDRELEQETNKILAPFASGNIDQLDNMIFVLPYDTHERTLHLAKNRKVLKRLINYGESYEPNDKQYAGYRIGILPVSQRDLSSVQRLVKAVDIHRKQLMIEWGLAIEECPICGSHNVIENGNDSFECLNPQCRALYAKPHCRHCGRQFSWVMTSVKIKKDYFSDDDKSIMEKILRNESVLGNVVITDFSIEVDKDGLDIRFSPRCPYCGEIS